MQDRDLYITPTYFIDSNHQAIVSETEAVVEGCNTLLEKVKALFYYVRDTYYYYPYDVIFDASKMKASEVLTRPQKRGYCIEKAVLFAAMCRCIDVPNRLIFCNVRNHIATGKVEEILGTDLMVFHGYNEVYINDKWVKCTVAFNQSLCNKLKVDTLEFDGETDQVFQEFDKNGGVFMNYEHEYGTFHDVPYDLWVSETKRLYPHLFTEEGEREFLKRLKKVAEDE